MHFKKLLEQSLSKRVSYAVPTSTQTGVEPPGRTKAHYTLFLLDKQAFYTARLRPKLVSSPSKGL